MLTSHFEWLHPSFLQIHVVSSFLMFFPRQLWWFSLVQSPIFQRPDPGHEARQADVHAAERPSRRRLEVRRERVRGERRVRGFPGLWRLRAGIAWVAPLAVRISPGRWCGGGVLWWAMAAVAIAAVGIGGFWISQVCIGLKWKIGSCIWGQLFASISSGTLGNWMPWPVSVISLSVKVWHCLRWSKSY